jgi:hypothetical protein
MDTEAGEEAGWMPTLCCVFPSARPSDPPPTDELDAMAAEFVCGGGGCGADCGWFVTVSLRLFVLPTAAFGAAAEDGNGSGGGGRGGVIPWHCQ